MTRVADDAHDGFALLSATARADVQEVHRLLMSASPAARVKLANFADYDRRSALHVACSEGYAPVVRELLSNGADWTCKDRFGNSCVHDAVAGGHMLVLRELAAWDVVDGARGAQPVDVLGDGLPAVCVERGYCWGRDLLCAVAARNVRAVTQLVRQYAVNVNFANADGRTALHLAAVNGDVPMAMYLLSAGADATREDRWGVSPEREALRCGFDKLAHVLRTFVQ